MTHYSLRGTIWIVVYLFFILAPLFALMAGAMPPARDFWTEFSAAIGYSGLAMMGLQFGLTARWLACGSAPVATRRRPASSAGCCARHTQK